MRAVLTDGREVAIEFAYVHPRGPKDVWERARWKPVHNGVTHCEITHGRTAKEKGTVLAEGMAVCALVDKFEKETGRLEALRRAAAELSQEDRRRVWDAYINRRRQAVPPQTAPVEEVTGAAVV